MIIACAINGCRNAATTLLDARALPKKMMHMMVSISDVSRRECRVRGVKDCGGKHGCVENGGGKRGGLDSIRGGQDGVTLPE